jgi:hypothetical protein
MSASATMLVTIAAILAGLAAWRLVDTWLKYRGRMEHPELVIDRARPMMRGTSHSPRTRLAEIHTEPQQVLSESEKPGSNVEYWGRFAAFWSLACVVALGAAFFLVPGVRPTLQAGAFTSATHGLVEGTILVVGFLTLLVAALYSLGIPEKRTPRYEPKVHSVQPPSGQSTAPTTIKAA